jgi:hypothetical protein
MCSLLLGTKPQVSRIKPVDLKIVVPQVPQARSGCAAHKAIAVKKARREIEDLAGHPARWGCGGLKGIGAKREIAGIEVQRGQRV